MLLCFTLAFAAEKTPAVPSPRPRVPEMSTAGKVIEVSDTVLKIERTLKGEAEIMEFFLEKPFTNIAVGRSDQGQLSRKGRPEHPDPGGAGKDDGGPETEKGCTKEVKVPDSKRRRSRNSRTEQVFTP